MADFIMFTAGATKVLDAGVTGKCKFALSTRPVEGTGSHKAADTLGSGIGEITGTGYAEQEQEVPAASGGSKAFTEMEWKTSSATDWPASVKSCVLIEGGVAICAWNLRTGGTARDLSGANTTEKFSPTLTLS